MLRCLNVSVLRQDPEGSLAPHDVREASGPIEPSDLFDVGHICHSGRRPSSAMKHGSQFPVPASVPSTKHVFSSCVGTLMSFGLGQYPTISQSPTSSARSAPRGFPQSAEPLACLMICLRAEDLRASAEGRGRLSICRAKPPQVVDDAALFDVIPLRVAVRRDQPIDPLSESFESGGGDHDVRDRRNGNARHLVQEIRARFVLLVVCTIRLDKSSC
jgi:hypothetical protein